LLFSYYKGIIIFRIGLVKEVISMATVSFTKDFSITKKETVERLEKGIQISQPLNTDSASVISKMKRSEKILLGLLRSKV
jgi:hypothetical protein